MKIFIGSSTETKNQMTLVASWLKDEGHQVMCWDDPYVFIPGKYMFSRLIEISNEVDAAVFIFGEDDEVWYRHDRLTQARDNVLIEYGLFAGVLSPDRAIICRHGKPKSATDIQGITTVALQSSVQARLSIKAWLENVLTDDYRFGVKVFESNKERLEYMIKRFSDSEIKSSIDDVSWASTKGLSRHLPEIRSLNEELKNKIDDLHTRIVYREIFIFNREGRIKLLRTAIENNYPGYSCSYFPGNPDFPLLQFVIIDKEEVLLLIDDTSSNLLAIRHPDIVKLFGNYYEILWDRAINLKTGSKIQEEEVRRLLGN